MRRRLKAQAGFSTTGVTHLAATTGSRYCVLRNRTSGAFAHRANVVAPALRTRGESIGKVPLQVIAGGDVRRLLIILCCPLLFRAVVDPGERRFSVPKYFIDA